MTSKTICDFARFAKVLYFLKINLSFLMVIWNLVVEWKEPNSVTEGVNTEELINESPTAAYRNENLIFFDLILFSALKPRSENTKLKCYLL